MGRQVRAASRDLSATKDFYCEKKRRERRKFGTYHFTNKYLREGVFSSFSDFFTIFKIRFLTDAIS